MVEPAELYVAIGGASGCRALAVAFYARVEREPLLRPFFPSTFTCAIEEFAAFLVQFLGGDAEATQRRWWLSLRESHNRFQLGPREREAWLRAMSITFSDDVVIADPATRDSLLAFFRASSAYVIREEKQAEPVSGQLGRLWDQQLAIDKAVASIRAGLPFWQDTALQDKLAGSRAVHASILALAVKARSALFREHVAVEIRRNPRLIHERYSGWRTLLHDASASGEIALVKQLLEMGAGQTDHARAPSPLYCAANECGAPEAGDVVRALVHQNRRWLNAPYGVKRCTPLHMAARRGNVDVIHVLLQLGAHVEARDQAGETPLRRAVNCNQVLAAAALLEHGADRNSRAARR